MLSSEHENCTNLKDLTKVQLLEDAEGNIHLKNIGVYPAHSEEEALNLLFVGDTNRAVSSTVLNMTSSRSHCIFTIYIKSQDVYIDIF